MAVPAGLFAGEKKENKVGEANNRGTYIERRNERLSVMVENAEVLIALRVDASGQLHFEMLNRDEPVNAASAAVALAAFLWANYRELAGQALSLNAAAVSGEADQFPEAAGGVVVLDSRGRDAKAEHAPVILSANGGVLTADRASNPTIELPASAKEQL